MARSYFECPECGEMVKQGRLACPHCGSDAETGWKDEEEIQYQSLDIPEPEWEEQVREAPSQPPWILITVIVILVVFVAAIVSYG